MCIINSVLYHKYADIVIAVEFYALLQVLLRNSHVGVIHYTPIVSANLRGI